jgi:hypothetical protein
MFPFVLRRDGGPELVIRRKDAVIPMPVLARRRHEIGEPVEELKRRELDDDPFSRKKPAASALTLLFHTPVVHATLVVCSVHYEGT